MAKATDVISLCIGADLHAVAGKAQAASQEDPVAAIALTAYNDGVRMLAQSMVRMLDGKLTSKEALDAVVAYGEGLAKELGPSR